MRRRVDRRWALLRRYVTSLVRMTHGLTPRAVGSAYDPLSRIDREMRRLARTR